MSRTGLFLLDANVLIALTDPDHISNSRATAWFDPKSSHFATCPITQGALIRFILRSRPNTTIQIAKQFLEQVVNLPGHEFWQDSVSFLQLPTKGVIGYKQVTDAYLVALAIHNKARLATFDRALAAVHTATAVLIP